MFIKCLKLSIGCNNGNQQALNSYKLGHDDIFTNPAGSIQRVHGRIRKVASFENVLFNNLILKGRCFHWSWYPEYKRNNPEKDILVEKIQIYSLVYRREVGFLNAVPAVSHRKIEMQLFQISKKDHRLVISRWYLGVE